MKIHVYLAVALLVFICAPSAQVHAIDVEDTVSPSLVSITASTRFTTEPYTVTVVFSESVAGTFDISDIETTPALSMSGLTTSDGASYTFSVTGPSDIHTLRVRDYSVQDAAGNELGQTESRVTVRYGDFSPTVVVSNEVVNGSVVGEGQIFSVTAKSPEDSLFCARVIGTSLANVEFTRCRPNIGELSVDYFFPLEDIPEGEYTFVVMARDSSNNETIPSYSKGTIITITYDVTPPVTSVTVPVATPTFSTQPTFTLTTNEPVTLQFEESCGNATPSSVNAGSTVLTFNTLTAGVYGRGNVSEIISELPGGEDPRCFITVTDLAGKIIYVTIPEFVVVIPEVPVLPPVEPPVGAGGGVSVGAPSGANGPISIVTGGSTGGVSPVVMTSSGAQPNPGRFVLDGQSALTPTSGLAVITPPAPVVAVIPPVVNPVVVIPPAPRRITQQTSVPVQRVVVRPQPRNNAPVVAGASITNGLVGNGVGNTIDTSVQTASASSAFGSLWAYMVSLFY